METKLGISEARFNEQLDAVRKDFPHLTGIVVLVALDRNGEKQVGSFSAGSGDDLVLLALKAPEMVLSRMQAAEAGTNPEKDRIIPRTLQ